MHSFLRKGIILHRKVPCVWSQHQQFVGRVGEMLHIDAAAHKHILLLTPCLYFRTLQYSSVVSCNHESTPTAAGECTVEITDTNINRSSACVSRVSRVTCSRQRQSRTSPGRSVSSSFRVSNNTLRVSA